MNFKRYFLIVLVIASLVSLGGCGLLSGSGPSTNSISSNGNGKTKADSYELIDLSPENIAKYMVPPPTAIPETVAAPTAPDVHLMPGDVLKIMISDNSGNPGAVFAPLAQGGTIFNDVRVDSKGDVTLPYLGTKSVRGATIPEAENIIREGVSGRASEAQVYVELTGDLSASVLVAGAVKAPGRFTSLQGPLTILDAINDAGGPLLEPYLITVILRTGKSAQSFNYQSLLQGDNMVVPPNSEIILERSPERFVALGAVTKQGLHDFPSAQPDLLQVLGSIGGLNDRAANPSGVFVFRIKTSEEGKPSKAQVFRLDLRNPISMFVAKKFLVEPNDTVYVTNAPVYELQKIISPIVQVLILGQDAQQY